jgi:L-aspartate oxidase
MASNSLLECLVFAHSAAQHMGAYLQPSVAALPTWDESQVIDSDEQVIISHNWDELRRFMWDYVGIVRSNKRLQRALNRITLLKQEVQEYYSQYRVNRDSLELRNLVIVAELIIRSAILRQENRGLHYNIDLVGKPLLPEKDTILSPRAGATVSGGCGQGGRESAPTTGVVGVTTANSP